MSMCRRTSEEKAKENKEESKIKKRMKHAEK
jgi:hypothetical protein